jgi:hypothetical protein
VRSVVGEPCSPSLYWAAGGTAGLSTIGGTPEKLGRAREQCRMRAPSFKRQVFHGFAPFVAFFEVLKGYDRTPDPG